MAKGLSAAKAKKILTDGYVKGKPLTAKQRKYFGAIANGATPLKAINGGWLDKYQNGGELNQKYIDSTLNANMDKRWVQRLYEKNPEFYLEGQTDPSTHYMESGDGYVYPRVMEGEDGQLKKVSREEGRSQGIKFPNDEIAQWFAKNYKKGTNVLKEYQMGGSLPGATGMMYGRTSGTTPEEPKKAQNGKAIDWSKQRKKYPGFMDNFKDEIEYDPEFVDFDSVQRAVRNVESLDGELMWNPESTATGLYGQRFSEIRNDYPGTRKNFVKDTVAQNEFFKRRFYDGLEASETTSLLRDANDLYNDYSPQIKNFPYSKEDIAVLSNFIGRGGTRKYLGYAIRDGKPLAEALPNVYGPSAKQSNKTPEEYLELARQYYKTNELKNGGRCWPGYKTVSGKTPFSKGSCQKAQDGTIQGPISKRKDFDGNWLSSMAAGNQRKNSYGNLGDLYRYFGGMDLKNKALYKSKYKPTNSKNPNAEYIAIKDSGFTNTVLDQASRIFVDGNIKSTNEYGDDYIDRKINDDTYGIPRQPGDAGAIGKFFISRGSDEEGDYISYYDVFDVGQPNSPSTFGELLGSVKPFEIYDRIYVKKDKKGKYIQKKNGGDVPKAQDGTSMISQYEEPAWYEKLLDYAASPMTTLGYLARGEDIPDNLPINMENRNTFDEVIDMVNPAAYIKYAASSKRNFDEGNYLDSGFDALSAIPIVPSFLKRGKGVVKKGLDIENAPLREMFNQPNIYPTSSPLPKNMEPYLSRRVYPFNKEQEVFESFLPIEAQLKNIDLKSIRYDADRNIIPNMQKGGVIEDDRGQWAYPGEVTKINSNNITMKGVNYPVLGISDTGDTQMMYPNGEYQYDGSNVTEYPMAKNGKSLVALDQLTNFTNYNTPQPGGWLDKYN